MPNNPNPAPRRGLRLGLVIAAVVLAFAGGFYASGHGFAFAEILRQGHGMGPGMGHGQGLGHGPGVGRNHTEHDEVNMPGLQGANATPEESAELAVMFRNFPTLSRTVENLPNGIRTVTTSSDPAVMEALVSHVTGMIGRVQDGDSPDIVIQSPTLDVFFERPEGMETTIDITDEGIVVVQTSDDPEIVDALHTHAGEVSAMAERGMQAVHDMMMARSEGN